MSLPERWGLGCVLLRNIGDGPVSVDLDYENLEKQRAHGSCLSELQIRRKRMKAVKDRDTAESLGLDY